MRDLLAVWPGEAMRRGVDGEAVINCKVSEQGVLFDCRVRSEKPAGMGFGAAAIALTPQLLMKPGTRDGKPVVGDVSIPITFAGLSTPATGSHIAGSRSPFSRTVLSNLIWDAAPAYDDVAGAYPKKAAAEAIGGRATLNCTLKADGRLSSCDKITEEPKGQGFATAARRLVPLFRAPTSLADGTSTAGALTQIPFVFTPEMLDPERRVIGKAQWAALPSGQAFSAGFPKAAMDAGVRQGRVVIACEAAAGGKLEACKVAKEEPPGLGFAAAAMALSPSFRIRPWTAEGLPTIGGSIQVPIRYQLPENAAAPATPAKP